jgi:hypothetical protein
LGETVKDPEDWRTASERLKSLIFFKFIREHVPELFGENESWERERESP